MAPRAEQAMSPCHSLGRAGGGSIHRDPNITHSLGAHPKIQVVADVFEEAPDHGGQMDDMGGLVLLKQGFGLHSIPGMGNFGVQRHRGSRPGWLPSQKPPMWSTHVKSASLEDTKIHFSSGRPSPSATTFSMAFPTKPVPPVTRMRLATGPVTSVMAKILQGVAGGESH